MRNAQNISATFDTLPWEEGRGFLWGLPSTVWLLIRHPSYSMSTNPKGKWFLPFLFFVIISFCTHSFILALVYLNIYDKDLLIDPPNTLRPLDLFDVISNFAQLLITSWMPDLLLIFAMSSILYIILKFAFKTPIKGLLILRIFFYAHIAIALGLIPINSSFIGYIWMLCLLFWGVKFNTFSNTRRALKITGCFWLLYSLAYFITLRIASIL